jgi:hypothetical protein
MSVSIPAGYTPCTPIRRSASTGRSAWVVLDMGGPAPGVLERVLGSTAEKAFGAWSGRGVSGLKPDSAENPSRRAVRASAPSVKKPRKWRAFLRAAEGIRTLDLLHGKQTL